MTPLQEQRLATHSIITSETCAHGGAVIRCPICDDGQPRCRRCGAKGMRLSLDTCAERLVGCWLELDDGWAGRGVSPLGHGEAIRIEFGKFGGKFRNVPVGKITSVGGP